MLSIFGCLDNATSLFKEVSKSIPPIDVPKILSQFETINKSISPIDFPKSLSQFEKINKSISPIDFPKSLSQFEKINELIKSSIVSRKSSFSQLKQADFKLEAGFDILEALAPSSNSQVLARKPLSSKTFLNSSTLKEVSDLPQKEKQDFYQTANNPQAILGLPNPIIIRRNGKLLKQVFLEIYSRVTCDDGNSVEWSPAAWFGNGGITRSMRAKWSNALKILVKKGLVELKVPDRHFSNNRGNAATYVSLTQCGYLYATQLMKKN